MPGGPASSPLSNFSSSTDTSLLTPQDSTSAPSTSASSPVHPRTTRYLDSRQLPRELKQHCQIFLEEQLYLCAIHLLNSILAAGRSRRHQSTKPVAIPPASHVALLNTLLVHPMHTTRAEKSENLETSSLALDYLRNLLVLVGPINANFRAAFQFCAAPRRNRRWDHGNDSDMSEGDSDDHDDERLRGRLANEGSLWSRGHDFWNTVGWAFNTSTLYPKRWKYWGPWLQFMLDVLQADWDERERKDEEAWEASGKTGHAGKAWRAEAIMVMYMEPFSGHGPKGMLKALLADGSDIYNSAFPEVFDKELRGPKKESKKRKRDTGLDLDNDNFGDYFDDESISSGVSEPPTPQKPRDGKQPFFGSVHPGYSESVPLRMRLFQLLSAATHTLKKQHELQQLYEGFAHNIKTLPIQSFSLFVSQRPNPLLDAAHITLVQGLFELLLPSSAKSPKKVDPTAHKSGDLSVLMLEECYLPYPANTINLEDNAKLSIVVENAIQLLWSHEMLEYTDALADAAEAGISAREAKGKKKRMGKGRVDASDEVAAEILEASAERIRCLLESMQMASQADDMVVAG